MKNEEMANFVDEKSLDALDIQEELLNALKKGLAMDVISRDDFNKQYDILFDIQNRFSKKTKGFFCIEKLP